jgi:hypothetical protein
VGNPDFAQYADIAPRMRARGATIEEICQSCRSYIRAFELGGGNWGGRLPDSEARGGMVYRVDEQGKLQLIGEVWYNGQYRTIEETAEEAEEFKRRISK